MSIIEACSIAIAQAEARGAGHAEVDIGKCVLDVDAQAVIDEHAKHTLRILYRLRLTVDAEVVGGDGPASELLAAAERELVATLSPWLTKRRLGITLDVSMPGDDAIALHHRTENGYRFAQYTIWRQLQHAGMST